MEPTLTQPEARIGERKGREWGILTEYYTMKIGSRVKRGSKLFFLSLTVFGISACRNINLQQANPTSVPRGPEILGVFAGNTPCGPRVRPLLRIPVDAGCDQMIWSLTLYHDPQSGEPSTYSLKTSYGLSKQGTNDLIDGGTPISMEGTWGISQGTKDDPQAVVYQINPDDPQTTVSFLKVEDDLIHVLDEEKKMLVGDGAWSFTLDRIGHETPAEAHEHPWWYPNPPTRPPQPPMPTRSTVSGVFDGRTPCHEVAMEFTRTAPADCLKIKWRLTLYQDSASGEPGRYLYMGTSKFEEGSWKIVHGLDGNPEAVVYGLQPDGSEQTFYFLKVDDNHLFLMDGDMNLLVGNEFFSYTLSRAEQGVQ